MNITYFVGMTAIATIWFGAKPAVGYLAHAGPAPLRFQEPVRGLDVTVALPPLAMKDPEPELEFFGPPIPTEEPPPATVVAVSSTNAAPKTAVAVPVDPMANLSPQMLVQYFNGNGTNRDYNVILPYQFTPPPAPNIPAPPSRATYEKK
jgi:hypothetical protein